MYQQACVVTSMSYVQGDAFLQDYKNRQAPVSQNVMSGRQGSSDFVSSPLMESINILSAEGVGHSSKGCLQVGETSDSRSSSFPIGDLVIQEHYGTFGTVLPGGTSKAHQNEDEEMHNPIEDYVNPAMPSEEDMETYNDSSSNEFRNEPMDSDENGKEHTPKRYSNCQPPPCSSSTFPLMMADSEHNPSTSGYSSEQPAKAKTQKELMKMLKELRSYLPPEKQSRGKSSTMASLRYALHCIQQVKAIEDYYQLLMVNDEHPYSQDLSCYTVQDIADITAEFTKKNTDVFAVAVSLVNGRILYISEQASIVLRCSAELFSHVRFVELLAPQDVGVFYSSTTPYRLPSWSMCNGPDSGCLDGLEHNPFYCRISCGHESRKEASYHPFRLTPSLLRVRTAGSAAEHMCCVLLAERVLSGYEAPRIPADKRIFTTTHTPGCLFQDVDERAVPLLGYLPQDLIGTPIIQHLHPSDRPLMLAVHKKILQYGGQPFDFSPIRFCARNGEYITIDTSWSSFINPWSRKVSFIIGRHKVRMGPDNEDLFTAPICPADRALQPDVQELTEQIHQLLMQPVHNSGSSGYGSLGSNGSHETPMSGASSSDSNGNLNEDIKEKRSTHPGQKSKDPCCISPQSTGPQSGNGSPEAGGGHHAC